MGIYGESMSLMAPKSAEILFAQLEQVISEHFAFESIIKESNNEIITESKFVDIIKNIFNKIKDGIRFVINKLKEIVTSVINSIKKVNIKDIIEDYSKEDKKRKDVKLVSKNEVEKSKEEKNDSENISVASKEKENLFNNHDARTKELNDTIERILNNSKTKTEEFMKDFDTKTDKEETKKPSYSLMVIPQNNNFINDKVFENYIDFDRVFNIICPVTGLGVIKAYMECFYLEYGFFDGSTTAGKKSNALSFIKNPSELYDGFETDFDFFLKSRNGRERFFKRIDSTIETCFPGILHSNWRMFKNSETNLETYKQELSGIIGTMTPYKQITSKEIYNNRNKYIYNSTLVLNNKWFIKTIGNYNSFLHQIEKQVNETQQIIEEMINKNIDYTYNNIKGNKYEVDIKLYNQYLQKLGKFVSTVLNGIQYLTQVQIKCIKAEIEQRTRLIAFYNSCYV